MAHARPIARIHCPFGRVGCPLTLASPAAMAGGYASISLSDINLSTVDLDPLDDIAPEMTHQ